MSQVKYIEIEQNHDRNQKKSLPFYCPEADNSLKKYINDLGHVLIYLPNHPYSGRNGYVFEQIIVMEKKLKRNLTQREAILVDHLNGNSTDNRSENVFIRK